MSKTNKVQPSIRQSRESLQMSQNRKEKKPGLYDLPSLTSEELDEVEKGQKKSDNDDAKSIASSASSFFSKKSKSQSKSKMTRLVTQFNNFKNTISRNTVPKNSSVDLSKLSKDKNSLSKIEEDRNENVISMVAGNDRFRNQSPTPSRRPQRKHESSPSVTVVSGDFAKNPLQMVQQDMDTMSQLTGSNQKEKHVQFSHQKGRTMRQGQLKNALGVISEGSDVSNSQYDTLSRKVGGSLQNRVREQTGKHIRNSLMPTIMEHKKGWNESDLNLQTIQDDESDEQKEKINENDNSPEPQFEFQHESMSDNSDLDIEDEPEISHAQMDWKMRGKLQLKYIWRWCKKRKNFFRKLKKCQHPPWAQPYIVWIRRTVDSNAFSFFMTIITIWSLFGEDLRLAMIDKSYDSTIDNWTFFVLISFCVEIFFLSLVQEGYFLSFYFWLDFICTISMFTDVSFVANAVTGTSDQQNDFSPASLQPQDLENTETDSNNNMAKVSATTRLGSKAGRIARVIRLVRLIRIIKLFKVINLTEVKTKGNDELKELANEQKHEGNEQKESRVGQKLNDLAQYRLVVLLLLMLFSTPILQYETYMIQTDSFDLSLKFLDKFDRDDPTFALIFQHFVERQIANIQTPLIMVFAGPAFWASDVLPNNLRTLEQEVVYYETQKNDYFVAIYDLRTQIKNRAWFSILTTITVCVILMASINFTTKTNNTLLISPIESMIKKVQNISKNPVRASHEEEENQLNKEEEEEKTKLKHKHQENDHKKKAHQEVMMETIHMEMTLTKVGGLLALGFGEAGSEIIAKNILNSQMNETEIQTTQPGQKVICIFGNCQIEGYDKITQILEEKVILFTNEVAEIVHGLAYNFSGSANKNINETFLLVWKFEQDDMRVNYLTNELELLPSLRVSQLCEMSMISFLKISAGLRTSNRLQKYRNNEDLYESVGDKRNDSNFEVQMKFGLHLGWAIEAAIGSYFKIDVSYMSPNVITTNKLMKSAQYYGRRMLFSGQLYDFFGDETKQQCRQIDKVVLNEMKEPLRVYTFDAMPYFLIADSDETHHLNLQEQKKIRVQQRLDRRTIKEVYLSGEIKASALFEVDTDIQAMRQMYNTEKNANFFRTYEEALQHYLEGYWPEAKRLFQDALRFKQFNDEPSQNLIKHMKKFNFISPKDFNGYSHIEQYYEYTKKQTFE